MAVPADCIHWKYYTKINKTGKKLFFLACSRDICMDVIVKRHRMVYFVGKIQHLYSLYPSLCQTLLLLLLIVLIIIDKFKLKTIFLIYIASIFNFPTLFHDLQADALYQRRMFFFLETIPFFGNKSVMTNQMMTGSTKQSYRDNSTPHIFV